MPDFRQKRVRRLYLGFVAAFVAVVVAATAYTLLRLRSELIDHQLKMTALQGRALEDYLTQSFHNIDITLQNVLEDSRLQGRREGIGEVFAAALRHAPYLRSISLLDDDMRIVASSNPRNQGITVVSDDFLPPVAAPSEILRIAPPWTGRDFDTGRPTTHDKPAAGDALTFLPVLRGAGDGGRPLTLLATVNPDYFLGYLSQQIQLPYGTVDVLRYDGTLLLSTHEHERPGSFRGKFAGGPGAAASNTAQQTVQGEPTMLNAYRASRHFPFTVVVKRDREAALDEWHKEVRLMLAIVGLSLAMVLLLAGFFYQRLLRTAIRQEETDQRLRLAAKVFDASAEGILITTADRQIASVNPAFTEITGYAAAEAAGRNPRFLASGQHDADFYRRMWQAIGETGQWQGEIINRRKNGTIYPEWLTITQVLDEAGRVSHYVGVFSDITERKASESRVRYLSEHDFLTGLPNRLLFQDRVSQAIARCQRHGGRLAILFIDLDRFKLVNDMRGHHIGDQLLNEVAERLRLCMRAADTACRQGGDEFLILVEDFDQPADCAQIAEKLLHRISQPYRIEGHDLAITPSIGIALYPDDGDDMEKLIRAADTAMYHSKEHGRNSYHFFKQSMNATGNERQAIEHGLRHALSRGELELHYQPLVNFKNGAITGVEALLRWTHPELGPISPLKFIPVAEESSFIVALGEWVLHEACRQAAQWDKAGLPALTLAINISPLQFVQDDFAATVGRILAETGLPGNRIEFEVTEAALKEQIEHRSAALAQLRDLGVRLTVDDFGTGYSSLSRLNKLPIDKLKIDRSFVRDVLLDPDDAALTATIIHMAHSIGLKVVAEGIESAEQWDFFRTRGCDEAQGFHFSTPLPPLEFAALQKRQAGRLRRVV